MLQIKTTGANGRVYQVKDYSAVTRQAKCIGGAVFTPGVDCSWWDPEKEKFKLALEALHRIINENFKPTT